MPDGVDLERRRARRVAFTAVTFEGENRGTTDRDRGTRGRWLLWFGLLSSFIYSTARTADDVAASSLGPWDILRVIGPVACVLGYRLTVGSNPTRYHGVELGFILFFLVAATSTVWSSAPLVTLGKAAAITGCYLAALELAKQYDTLEAAAHDIATVVHLLLIAAAAQWLLIPELVFAALGQYDPVPRLRMVAPQVGTNALGFLASAGILALVLQVGPRRLTQHVSISAPLGAVYLGIMLATRTRAALILTSILLITIFLLWFKRRPASVISASLATVATFLAFPSLSSSLREFVLREQAVTSLQTLTGRTELWWRALATWREAPLTGHGYFTGHRLDIPGLISTQSNVDSTWIEALVDVGLLGTAPLALAAVSGAVIASRVRPLSGGRLWLILILTYQFVISFVSPTLQSPGLNLMLFAVPLLAISRLRESNGASSHHPITSRHHSRAATSHRP